MVALLLLEEAKPVGKKMAAKRANPLLPWGVTLAS